MSSYPQVPQQISDPISENLAKLRELFPSAVKDGALDVDALRAELGEFEEVHPGKERYELNWVGKTEAKKEAFKPLPGKTLALKDDGKHADTTGNLYIEGDNLEALKLLRQNYFGEVKMIYIDPPYNTGEDFVYADKFTVSAGESEEEEGAVTAEGKRLIKNEKTSNRFHARWLDMMYPRLKLSKDLLKEDGVIFISIDDNEIANLRLACDEIFGSDNFIAEIVWEGANKNTAQYIGVSHEYILVYSRNLKSTRKGWTIKKEDTEPVLKEVSRLKKKYGDDYAQASDDLAGWFRSMKGKPAFGHRRFKFIDKHGAYKEDDPTAPGGRKFELHDPRDKTVLPLRRNRGWAFTQEEFNEMVEQGKVSFITKTSVMIRRYLHETDRSTPQSVIYQPARSASERLTRLMDGEFFDYPKDEAILKSCIEMASETNALVQRPVSQCAYRSGTFS